MKAAAFFDVDYTLINGSTSVNFMLFLLRKGKISPLIIMKSLYYLFLYKLDKMDYEELSKKTKLPFVENRNTKEIKDLSEELFKKSLIRKINKNALKRIRFHKKQRHKIVLASASLDFIIRPLAKYIGADFIATKTEIKDNLYTGKLVGNVCYGKNKADKVNDYSNKHNISLEKSYAYTDHISDIDFLKIIGNPFVVNPNKKLKKIANRYRINIIKF
ncbi:HAD family hydrolase [Candidatus Woesearchaeota archaeon]|nr:HAD family hydrolase [Candidatus Woesearchaeota archaeon]